MRGVAKSRVLPRTFARNLGRSLSARHFTRIGEGSIAGGQTTQLATLHSRQRTSEKRSVRPDSPTQSEVSREHSTKRHVQPRSHRGFPLVQPRPPKIRHPAVGPVRPLIRPACCLTAWKTGTAPLSLIRHGAVPWMGSPSRARISSGILWRAVSGLLYDSATASVRPPLSSRAARCGGSQRIL
jgi:hypothetical protein